jgi:8-oxo-dGTP pyrophosphatase MutT (NUDIX family)
MSIVVVTGGHRWPLPHGRDPQDLLAEHGWSGEPVRAVLGEQGRIEVHYSSRPLSRPAPAAAVAGAHPGARVHQRIAAYALVRDGHRLLVSRLADWVGGAGGLWTLPGGGIDPGEEPVDAVVRECYEETGQHVVVDELVQVQSMHWRGESEDFHAVRLVYRARCPEPTQARVIEIDGSTGAAAWVPLAELPELPSTQMIGAALSHVVGQDDG